MKTKIVMAGSEGRMGVTILKLAYQDPEIEVVGSVDQNDSLDDVIASTDVVIDFSHFSVTKEIAEKCATHNKALVIGTTGHKPELKKEVLDLAEKIPMIFAPNYSVGVNTLFYVTRKTAEILGSHFDQEVVEMHHRFKKDSPSGTAERLVEILAHVKQQEVSALAKYGREGDVGERTQDEIGVHSLRGGDVVGDHTVVFATQGERVELTHKASSRDTFGSGALRAAKFLNGRDPGVYNMFDVLGLE